MLQDCNGAVSSGHGQVFIITGRVEINGLHVKKDDLNGFIRGIGATSKPDWARNVTILLTGIQSSRELTDDRRRFSRKIVSAIEYMHDFDSHVHFIDGNGLQNLMLGIPADCKTSIWRKY